MELGKRRYEEVLQPVTGRAVPVNRGEILRVIQLFAGQCVDFNAFNLHDYKEHMSIGHSRQQGLHLSERDTIVSNPPRHRPMLHISHMPQTCVGDTLGARCDAVLFERMLGFSLHTNCQDTLAEAIREYGLTPDDTHDSFNMFFNTRWDESGRWWIERNTGRKGDYVDLLACMDTLSVPIVCGSGDVQPTSNFFLKPIKIEIYGSTDATLEMVEEVEREYAAPKSRRQLEDFKIKEIRVERELTIDTAYEPDYPRSPLKTGTVTVTLPVDSVSALEGLVEEDFETDVASAARRAFMEWFLKHRTRGGGEKRSSLFQGGLKH